MKYFMQIAKYDYYYKIRFRTHYTDEQTTTARIPAFADNI
jgi:hypothetical protein